GDESASTAECSSTAAPPSSRVASPGPTSAPSSTVGSPTALECGGEAAVPAAVVSSPVAELNAPPIEYDVVGVRTAPTDPAWARFSLAPKPHVTDFQNAYGVVHCENGEWRVVGIGTDLVGCPGGGVALPIPPPAVRSDLHLVCN